MRAMIYDAYNVNALQAFKNFKNDRRAYYVMWEFKGDNYVQGLGKH
jgi:hypothetical protein